MTTTPDRKSLPLNGPDGILDDAGRTDVANARRFAAMHGEDVLWVEPWRQWLIFDGTRWAADAALEIEARAKLTAQAVWKLAGMAIETMADAALARDLTSFARVTASARGIGNMLALAKSEAGIPASISLLDADPWLLNCANGTINLRTGELLPHNRNDLLTKLCPTEFSPEATAPIWENALARIFWERPAVLRFVQRFLGAALVGQVFDHVLALWHGTGANGKSLLVETMLDVLGDDFCCKAPSELLLASKGDRHPTEKALLHGKRLVVATETDDGRRLAEALCKELTGGDKITARRMRENFWTFAPSHSVVLVTNHKPKVSGTDDGVWRRLRLVPFVQRFWDADRGESGPDGFQADKRLKDKLQAERSGILRWLVEGCLAWQREGLQEPEEVLAATAEYRTAEDVLSRFFAECCALGAGMTTKASSLRSRYEGWCKANGERPCSGRKFGESIRELGATKRTSNGSWWDGILVLAENEEELF